MTEVLRELSGAWNFRDVADGAPAIRPGRLFRSGELSRLEDGGRATLNELGITDVADLRANQEVAKRGPGLVPDGVEIHRLPLPDLGDQQSRDDEAPHEHAFRRLFEDGASQSDESVNEAAVRHMIDEYRQFPIRNGAQRAVQQVFSMLACGRSVLTHCFAGKDRTGFVIATVLEVLEKLTPEYVAPVVAYLCSEEVPETASVFIVGGGKVQRTALFQNAGITFDSVPSVEDIAAKWGQITDLSAAKQADFKLG